MFDVIPYWMWAASLLVLALVCGAALNPRESRKPARLLARDVHGAHSRAKWPARRV
ncbi:hypothetical protein SAMN05443245_2347 [Paraburkholderia fungorum]|uniref:Uncharacterized protein n=1 Tax=Paraburkholderia fungorum TaxID=134537 RepID=A0A1H1CWB8_9BURK|nr:hypothetical protein [Paraburkholderia fungorum]SDQ68571.1 hypothetical protein SAMN05443245_2347 [Paraburkholderia fungorum]